MGKLTDRTRKTTAASDDLIHFVDVSDATQDPAGSSFSIEKSNFLADYAPIVGGKIPESLLPSYVGDVLEYDDFDDFPATGELGKIYVDLEENTLYRWSGSVYVAVGGTGSVIWGGITGDLSTQTDLQAALNTKLGSTSTAVNSTKFNNLLDTQFLRSDTEDIKTSGNLTFNDYVDLVFGTLGTMKMFSSGSNNYLDLADNLIIRDFSGGSSINRFTFTNETGNFTATGSVTATAFFESSDKNLKTNIKEISPTFKTFEFKKALGLKRYGVIAQEIELTHPELVKTNSQTGLKAVNYVDLLCMKVAEHENTISEQNKRIEALETKLELLIKTLR